ncbi:MAG: tetratricopeptide repeat protein [Bacteroidota bacterium]
MKFSTIWIVLSIASTKAFSQSLEGDSLFHKAGELQKNTKYDSAIILFQNASKIYLENNQIEKSLEARLLVANTYKKKGLFESALVLCNDLLEDAKSQGNSHFSFRGQVYDELGRIYGYMEDYEKALSCSVKADSILSSLNGENHKKSGLLKIDIAMAYHNLNQYVKALDFIERAEEFYLNHTDSSQVSSNLYLNKSQILSDLGFMLKAEEAIKKGMDIRIKRFGLEHPENAGVYNRAAIFFHKSKNYNQALIYYERALAIFKSTLPNPHIWRAYINFYMLLG